MAALDLQNYTKQHVTIEGPDGVYLGRELDKLAQSVTKANVALNSINALFPLALTNLAGIATGTFLGNISGGTASPVALTATQVTANLNVMVGATGTVAGTKGLVPAPAATDNVKYLRGDGTYQTIDLTPYMQKANNLSDLTNFVTARTNLGISTVGNTGAYADLTGKPTLGTAAALNVGTAANNVVQLDATPKLPAVNGSALTNLTQCQPAITSSTYPVGTFMLAYNVAGTTVANAGTLAGSSMNGVIFQNTLVTDSGGFTTTILQPVASGVTLPGTWTNVSGAGSSSATPVGYWYRSS